MARVIVSLPVPLRRFAGGAAEVYCAGDTVGAVLSSLAAAHPHMGRGLLEATGRPRRFVRLYLDDVDVETLGGIETPLVDGARLTIVVAMAGG